MGLLLLLAAFKNGANSPTPTSRRRSGWPRRPAFLPQGPGAGAAIMAVDVKQLVLTLTAIDLIQGAALGAATAAAVYLFYTLVVQMFVLLPLLAYARRSGRTSRARRRAGWSATTGRS
ncbi:MAG: GAP family protein [Anaerolineae bacterium]|nr:MAG: GAP family protein [Anaerolineae bacterium]